MTQNEKIVKKKRPGFTGLEDSSRILCFFKMGPGFTGLDQDKREN